MYVLMYVYICMYVYIYVYICVYMYIYMYVCMHVFLYIAYDKFSYPEFYLAKDKINKCSD